MFSFYQNRLLYTIKLILNFGVQEFQTDVPRCSKKFSISYVSWPIAISIMDFERCKDVHVITRGFFLKKQHLLSIDATNITEILCD